MYENYKHRPYLYPLSANIAHTEHRRGNTTSKGARRGRSSRRPCGGRSGRKRGDGRAAGRSGTFWQTGDVAGRWETRRRLVTVRASAIYRTTFATHTPAVRVRFSWIH